MLLAPQLLHLLSQFLVLALQLDDQADQIVSAEGVQIRRRHKTLFTTFVSRLPTPSCPALHWDQSSPRYQDASIPRSAANQLR